MQLDYVEIQYNDFYENNERRIIKITPYNDLSITIENLIKQGYNQREEYIDTHERYKTEEELDNMYGIEINIFNYTKKKEDSSYPISIEIAITNYRFRKFNGIIYLVIDNQKVEFDDFEKLCTMTYNNTDSLNFHHVSDFENLKDMRVGKNSYYSILTLDCDI